MSDTADYVIGTEVSCTDGVCGELRRVVVDPVARVLTHLVVEPKHRPGAGHLVPIDLVDTGASGVHLRCTSAEFDALDDAEETRFLTGASGQWGYALEEMLSWPYYGLGGAQVGMGGVGMGGIGLGGGLGMGGMVGVPGARQTFTEDNVPDGEIEIRRGEPVHATDGEIGRVQGLVIDPSDHRVTHVLLDEGHLWGKKTVTIPIEAVANVDVGVRLTLTKDQVRDLPPVDLGE
jgi:sporulation protein YlmC with PRC-barrel domain